MEIKIAQDSGQVVFIGWKSRLRVAHQLVRREGAPFASQLIGLE
jgi:hypothetical protein